MGAGRPRPRRARNADGAASVEFVAHTAMNPTLEAEL
jgi:hypothetical protein